MPFDSSCGHPCKKLTTSHTELPQNMQKKLFHYWPIFIFLWSLQNHYLWYIKPFCFATTNGLRTMLWETLHYTNFRVVLRQHLNRCYFRIFSVNIRLYFKFPSISLTPPVTWRRTLYDQQAIYLLVFIQMSNRFAVTLWVLGSQQNDIFS